MKLENQVCSLELAERLKELDVKQDSYFKWSFEDTSKPWFITVGYITDKRELSAFTVAELGDMLPAQLHLLEQSAEHPVHQFITEKQFSQRHSVYVCAGCMGKLGSQVANTEADARAKMVIYLLENQLIKQDA